MLYLRFLGYFPLLIFLIISFYQRDLQHRKFNLCLHSEMCTDPSINSFAFKLLSSIHNDDVIISPWAIASCLSLLFPGMTPDSAAETQLRELIASPISSESNTESETTLQTVNAALVTSKVLPSFTKSISILGAAIFSNPSSSESINEWIKLSTNGNIESIIDKIPPNLVALLINAVYFKGDWSVSFNPKKTRRRMFNDEFPIEMMEMRKEMFMYSETTIGRNRVQLVELRYASGSYTAVILLPQRGSDLKAVVGGLDEISWQKLIQSMAYTEIECLVIPKFKQTFGATSLKSQLYTLGLQHVFEYSKESPAFLKMVPSPEGDQVVLDDVIHKATLEVTEEGTEASAAVVSVITSRSMKVGGKRMIVDRPFLFVIRDANSGDIVFIGRVYHPVPVEAIG